MGGGGGNANLTAPAGPNVMQPGPMPGYVPPAPGMPQGPVAPPPNLGTPPAPMPSLAAGVTLPPQRRATTSGDRMIALGKALQGLGAQQGQQQQRGGRPVNFNTPYQPYVPPPTPTGNGG